MPRKQTRAIAEPTEIQTQSEEMNDTQAVGIDEGKQFLRLILKAAIIRRRMPSRVPKALKIQMFSKLTRKSMLILKILTRVTCHPMKKTKNPRPRRPAKLETPKAEQLHLSLIN